MQPLDLSRQTLTPPAQSVAAAAAAPHGESDTGLDFSFHDLIEIVNPLQHIPIVGTIYRAITGDQIKTPEKIAGDTLYGGLWGFVSSVADTAFQAITGKNFGDTVLALLTGNHDTKAVAVAKQPAQTPSSVAQNSTPDVTALSASLARSGVDSETAQRAVYAYRRAYGLVGPELAPI